MREHYDFSKMKGQRNPYVRRWKQPITIRLDKATVAYFKALASEVGMPSSIRLADKLVWIQFLLCAILVAPVPFVRSFLPYDGIYKEGIYSVDLSQDPLFALRASLIIGGLLITLYTCTVAAAFSRVLEAALPLWCGALCVREIGWVLYPYWINGMYQAYLGRAAVRDFDPKCLMPMIWIGDIWRALGIWLPDLAIKPIGASILAIATVLVLARRRSWVRLVISLLFLGIAFFCLGPTPRYGEWICD